MIDAQISVADKTKLEELGFYVEDMQLANGDGWWNGMFRWMRTGSDEFQESDPSGSETEAWASALLYAQLMSYV